jgi:hypothetical protein
VLLAQLLDDLRARRGLVAENAATGLVHERVDDLVRKAVRVRRERRRRDDTHQLPVAGGGVLALRTLEQPAGDRWSPGLRRAAFERHDVAETECLEVREVEPADRLRDVAERVRALVPVLAGIRQLPCPDRVEDDHTRTRH